jgi:hypothetical protein
MPFADNVTIDGCYFRYITHYTLLNAQEGDFAPGHEGIEVQGDNVAIKNCSIEYSAGPGIKMNNPDTLAEGATGGCKNPVIENNLIRYIDYYASYGAGINTCTKGGRVAHNTIYQTGRSGLGIGCGGGWFIGHHVNIQYNRIYDCMITCTDGGCVYTYGVTARHSDFSHNWIYNNHQKEGSLLMLDLGGWDWYIHHNVFWIKDGKNYSTIGPSYSRNLVYNNTIIDQGWAKKTHHGQSNNLCCYGNPDSCGIVDAENFDFSLKSTSIAIDKGDSIVSRGSNKIDDSTGDTTWYTSPTGVPMHDTITRDMFTGVAPDLGAYEYGMPSWKAGHDWGEPDWEYPLKPEGSAIARLVSMRISQPRMLIKQHMLMITGESWKLNIYDAAGRIVRSVKHDKKERTTVRISITDFASGMYLAQLKSEAGIKTVPMIRF